MGKILLPIETKTREFFGKTWLAMHLAEHGHEVIIGDKSPIYNRYAEFEPDVFIEKSAFAGDHHVERIKELKQSGCAVIFLDEEGGVFRSSKSYVEKRSTKQINLFNHVFAWGKVQAEAIIDHAGYSRSKVSITGNPRFDLLHPGVRAIYNERSSDLKDRFNKYILFNTNFALANHYDPSKLDPSRDRNVEMESRIRATERVMSHFIDAIEIVSEELGEYNVVIRPHPSEDSSTYEREFSSNNSIYVDSSGDVREWILGAAAVVHNSCTTGIESAWLNVPTFALEVDGDDPRVELPNIVSERVQTPQTLVDAILNREGSSYEMSPDAKNHLQRYFYNIEEMAAPAIAKNIDRIVHEKEESDFESYYSPFSNWNDFKRSPFGRWLESIYYLINDTPSSRFKFRGISFDEIQRVSQELTRSSGHSDVTVTPINRWEDIYRIKQ